MGYKKVWPIFGSANQLLAALSLLGIAAFLLKQKKSTAMVMIPMVFMFAVTLTALVLVMKNNIIAKNYPLLMIAVILFVLAIVLIVQTIDVFSKKKTVSKDINA